MRVVAGARARVSRACTPHLHAMVGEVDAARVIGDHGLVAGDPHVTQLAGARAEGAAGVKHGELCLTVGPLPKLRAAASGQGSA